MTALLVGRTHHDTNGKAIVERDNLLRRHGHVRMFREPKGESQTEIWHKPHIKVPGNTMADPGPYLMSQRGAPPAHPSGGCVLQARTSVVNKTANAAATFLEEINQKAVTPYRRPVRGLAGKATELKCVISIFLHNNRRDKEEESKPADTKGQDAPGECWSPPTGVTGVLWDTGHHPTLGCCPRVEVQKGRRHESGPCRHPHSRVAGLRRCATPYRTAVRRIFLVVALMSHGGWPHLAHSYLPCRNERTPPELGRCCFPGIRGRGNRRWFTRYGMKGTREDVRHCVCIYLFQDGTGPCAHKLFALCCCLATAASPASLSLVSWSATTTTTSGHQRSAPVSRVTRKPPVHTGAVVALASRIYIPSQLPKWQGSTSRNSNSLLTMEGETRAREWPSIGSYTMGEGLPLLHGFPQPGCCP